MKKTLNSGVSCQKPLNCVPSAETVSNKPVKHDSTIPKTSMKVQHFELEMLGPLGDGEPVGLELEEVPDSSLCGGSGESRDMDERRFGGSKRIGCGATSGGVRDGGGAFFHWNFFSIKPLLMEKAEVKTIVKFREGSGSQLFPKKNFRVLENPLVTCQNSQIVPGGTRREKSRFFFFFLYFLNIKSKKSAIKTFFLNHSNRPEERN